MFDIEELIKDEFLNTNNKKISNETLKEYLTSLKNDELTKLAIIQVFVDKDYTNLFKVKSLNNKPKKYIVEYITENLNKILESYLKIINDVELQQLKFIIDNNGKKISFIEKPISIHFINFLKLFSLAKVEYDKKNESIKFFMPKEFIEILENSLNNKELLKINKYNNKIFNYSEMVINTYGIITLKKLHEIFESQMFKIDIDELNYIIQSKSFFEETHIYLYNDEILLCNCEFEDEDYALNFYKEQKMNYRIFGKKDYELINEGLYADKLKSYKKFINYLCKNYMGIDKDIDFIKEMIVNDYLYSAQICIEEADNNFKNNMEKIIEVDKKTLDELLVLMKKIYKDYPKWLKRGNV